MKELPPQTATEDASESVLEDLYLAKDMLACLMDWLDSVNMPTTQELNWAIEANSGIDSAIEKMVRKSPMTTQQTSSL